MKPDLRCYHHPDREATSQCDRCGDYLCSECVHEHDELHVCARCLEDVTPRDEIGKSAKIACVINALACSLSLVPLSVLPDIDTDVLAAISLAMSTILVSIVAVSLALSDMRGRAGGELLFRWSVVISAGGSALAILAVFEVIAATLEKRGLLTASVMLLTSAVLLLTSVVLLASVWKKARPIWALVVALLAPLIFGSCLLRILVQIWELISC